MTFEHHLTMEKKFKDKKCYQIYLNYTIVDTDYTFRLCNIIYMLTEGRKEGIQGWQVTIVVRPIRQGQGVTPYGVE